MRSDLEQKVITSFGEASSRYNSVAKIQRKFAWELATQCSKQIIPPGIWLDLGTGTGLLADALEEM